jgi:hypothetical protein
VSDINKAFIDIAIVLAIIMWSCILVILYGLFEITGIGRRCLVVVYIYIGMEMVKA